MPISEPFELKTPGSSQFNYFKITNDGILTKSHPMRDREEFWDKIFDEFKQNWNTTFDFHSV